MIKTLTNLLKQLEKFSLIISGEDKAALSKLDIKKTTGRICSNDSAGGFSKIS